LYQPLIGTIFSDRFLYQPLIGTCSTLFLYISCTILFSPKNAQWTFCGNFPNTASNEIYDALQWRILSHTPYEDKKPFIPAECCWVLMVNDD
jgi:hypothetical protein